jgi:F-box/TPR repeat protein Pof3
VCKGLAELEFITLPHTMSSTLIDIVGCAPQLEKFIVHPDITLDTAAQILNSRPTVKYIGFNAVKPARHMADWKRPFPNLETFSMQFSDPATILNVSPAILLKHTPTLKVLNLFNVQSPSEELNHISTLPLTTLILKRVRLNGYFPALPPTLQKLVVETDGSNYQMSTPELHLLRSKVPALTHLSLTGYSMLEAAGLEELLDIFDDEGQIKLLENATPLTSLTIRGVIKHSDHGLFNPATDGLLARSPRILTPALQHLDIATMPCTDDEIEYLLARDVGLVSIDLSCTHITGASIKMLVDKLPGIKVIRADNCARINGRDAIEFARRNGVMVTCSMGEGKGSRKVRY